MSSLGEIVRYSISIVVIYASNTNQILVQKEYQAYLHDVPAGKLKLPVPDKVSHFYQLDTGQNETTWSEIGLTWSLTMIGYPRVSNR
jgi:hypothetical protein